MNALITQLKACEQDHEFYPTTGAIIAAMIEDFKKITTFNQSKYGRAWDLTSWLDIGAGNGKVLDAIQSAFTEDRAKNENYPSPTLYAIEKADILIGQLDPNIIIIGTDFQEQTLYAKNIDVTFSNPPYSEFVPWTCKILRESVSTLIYLVIPIRWQNNPEITAALEYRKFKAKIIGQFDFLESEDRKARATVHLIRISNHEGNESAFNRFFAEAFPGLEEKFPDETEYKRHKEKDEEKRRQEKFDSQIIDGECLPKRLVRLYMAEMERLQHSYSLLAQLEPEVYRTLKISLKTVRDGLREKLSSIRAEYWHELFNNCTKLTDKLTTSSRDAILNQLRARTEIDFTYTNILAVLIWSIKKANQYINGQFIETYEKMVEKSNIQNYKSNQRVWQEDRHRYYTKPENPHTHFGLDYRIVCQHVGGIRCGYSWERGLSERACSWILDLLTLAKNLGFETNTCPPVLWHTNREHWVSGKKVGFYGSKDGKSYTLIEVRAFQNGNLHLRFDQTFMLALNVEYGRLKGWLKSPINAAVELKNPEARHVFASYKPIDIKSAPLLLSAS